MRLQGTLTNWNDSRGFGYIESTQGGEPIFVHISAWPRGPDRPQVGQTVSFEIEVGPKGKRARAVQRIQASRRTPRRPDRESPAAWGTATLFVLPAFLLLYLVLAMVWKLPSWLPALYLGASAVSFVAYAADKAAAARNTRRTPEKTLHLLSLAGGWPGALLAQQFLRHKSAKQSFRQVFWATVMLNTAGLVLLASPVGRGWLGLL